VGGSVIVANPADEELDGRVTVYTSAPDVAAVSRPITVPARDSREIDLRGLQSEGSFLSAVVEIDNGGGFVEQVARHPAGDAVAACSNAASSNWYFADGFTVDDSPFRLVLTNPYPDAAIVDIGFVTDDGIRNPSRLQGFPVPGRSVRVVDLGARDEAVIGTKIRSTRGRVVAGRSQQYLGGGRLGYTMTLGAPSLSSQWYFADGETGQGITEQYAVYNPTDQPVDVDVVFLGVDPSDAFLNDTSVTVEPGDVQVLSTADVAGLPTGRHGAVFSTFSESSIVVERILTRPVEQRVATTVVMGSPPALASPRWSAAIGTEAAAEDAIVVLNVDFVDTVVTLKTLGPGGLVEVEGLEAIPLAAGEIITIPLTDPSVLGAPFVVEAGQRIYVERSLPRGDELRGRSGSFALAG